VVEGSTDREWAYVAMSRGREANTLYLIRPDLAEECTHLAHRSPDPNHAMAGAFHRSSAQVAALDAGTPRQQKTDPGGPPPPSSDLGARLDWLIARREAGRDLERVRRRERSGLARDPPALGIGC
jgi:hypothetical protein